MGYPLRSLSVCIADEEGRPLPPDTDAAYTGDDNGNGNGNFKITAHLKAMQFYYIAVSHSTGGYGDYTLKFKFLKDYCNDLVKHTI